MFLDVVYISTKNTDCAAWIAYDSMSMSANLCPFGRRQNHWGLTTWCRPEGERTQITVTRCDKMQQINPSIHQSISQLSKKDWFNWASKFTAPDQRGPSIDHETMPPRVFRKQARRLLRLLVWKFLSGPPKSVNIVSHTAHALRKQGQQGQQGQLSSCLHLGAF